MSVDPRPYRQSANRRLPKHNDAIGWLQDLMDCLAGVHGDGPKADADAAMQEVFEGKIAGHWNDWRDLCVPLRPVTCEATEATGCFCDCSTCQEGSCDCYSPYGSDLDLRSWTHHEECDWTPEGAVVPCLGEPDCTPSEPARPSDAGAGPMSDQQRPSVLDAVAQVEALAAEVYADAMGRDWPVPYSALKVSEQEEWRGRAYCATYAFAICPVTKTVHPWLRSWCEPSCRPAQNDPAMREAIPAHLHDATCTHDPCHCRFGDLSTSHNDPSLPSAARPLTPPAVAESTPSASSLVFDSRTDDC